MTHSNSGELTIFLSHSKPDGLVVEKIKRNLESTGLNVYIYEDDRQPGTPIPAKVINALEDSDLVLAIQTPNSIDSQWIRDEMVWAAARKIPLIPVLEQSLSPPGGILGADIEIVRYTLGEENILINNLEEVLEVYTEGVDSEGINKASQVIGKSLEKPLENAEYNKIGPQQEETPEPATRSQQEETPEPATRSQQKISGNESNPRFIFEYMFDRKFSDEGLKKGSYSIVDNYYHEFKQDYLSRVVIEDRNTPLVLSDIDDRESELPTSISGFLQPVDGVILPEEYSEEWEQVATPEEHLITVTQNSLKMISSERWDLDVIDHFNQLALQVGKAGTKEADRTAIGRGEKPLKDRLYESNILDETEEMSGSFKKLSSGFNNWSQYKQYVRYLGYRTIIEAYERERTVDESTAIPAYQENTTNGGPIRSYLPEESKSVKKTINEYVPISTSEPPAETYQRKSESNTARNARSEKTVESSTKGIWICYVIFIVGILFWDLLALAGVGGYLGVLYFLWVDARGWTEWWWVYIGATATFLLAFFTIPIYEVHRQVAIQRGEIIRPDEKI